MGLLRRRLLGETAAPSGRRVFSRALKGVASSEGGAAGGGDKDKDLEELHAERVFPSVSSPAAVDAGHAKKNSIWEVFHRVYHEKSRGSNLLTEAKTAINPWTYTVEAGSPSSLLSSPSQESAEAPKAPPLAPSSPAPSHPPPPDWQESSMPKRKMVPRTSSSAAAAKKAGPRSTRTPSEPKHQRYTLLGENTLFLQELGLTLNGISLSGMGTMISAKEASVCFDAGRYYNGIEGARVFAISHGHADHIGALHQILRIRGQTRSGSAPPTVLMPECYVESWTQLLKCSTLLDAGPEGTPLELNSICNIQPVPVDEVSRFNLNLPRGLEIVSLPVDHRVPTCAYALIATERSLHNKYRSLSSREISDLAAKGVQVSETKEVVKLAFTGDTTIDGILRHPQLLTAKVLLMECTFMCDRTEKRAVETKHVHLYDIARNADKFENDLIVLIHISERYTYRDAVNRVLQMQRDIPSLSGRVIVWRGR